MQCRHTRRQWLTTAAGALTGTWLARGAQAPTAPVAVSRCRTYDPAELVPALQTLFDQLGGLGRLVKGKTVAIKINLTGAPTYRIGHLPLEDTHYTNQHVIAATVHLMGKAGARRIRLLESPWSTADPVEEYILQANWEPRDILGAAQNVEFENTNYLGRAKKYSRMKVPFGGYIYPAFDLNHSYEDCDVFVSLAKMKEHATAGITLSMKNCFGLTPATIYGTGAGIDEPSVVPKGGRGMVHGGDRQPSKSAPAEKDPSTPRIDTYRVPRTVVDLISARPIHLAIVEGVKTMTGGEGPWVSGDLQAVAPGVIVAGLNPVTTDAVSMALMGFDPMADRGTPPFERCDSTLKLAEDAGVGTRDLKRIEVIGTPISQAVFDFAGMRKRRRSAPPPPVGIRG
uniref:DUF362 domain-containing protein n=1 Tax=Solibacter usitatus (strain Ellin6076) TaxID=234267 RepID=Q01ZF9_SOLUE